jgi:hypothetical protein
MCKFIILFLILISVLFIGGENIIIKYTEDSIIEGARSKSKPKFKLSDLGKKKFYKNTAKSIQKSKIYKASGINKFLAPAKKKKVAKPKPVFNLKPVESADYSDNIIPPYVGDNFNSIRKDITEYSNALDGKPSKKLVSPAPLGKQYFFKTGVKCADMNTGQLVDRYSIIDSRVGVKNEDGTIDNSIFASAVADFNQSTIFKKQANYAETLADKCIPITIEPVDVYGKKLKPETRHVSVVDIQKFDDTQLGPNEGFATLNMEKMNAGQQAFIYSASVLGLYLLFRAMQK